MNTCVVCRSNQFKPLWRELQQCLTCGHVMANIDLESLQPAALYNDDYFSGDEYADYLRDRKTLERNFSARLKEVRRVHNGGALIEIGCAYGYFLNLARAYFSVRGFDIAESALKHAKNVFGLPVENSDFLDARLENETADVIVMWDTIEHLLRPDLVVSKASKVLKDGGSLFLTTGDIGSLLARLRGKNWRLIHPPTHLHYFNKDSIRRLLKDAGLETTVVKYVPVWRSLRQILYSLFALGKDEIPNFYHRVENSRIGEISIPLNTMDIMLVVGRKTN